MVNNGRHHWRLIIFTCVLGPALIFSNEAYPFSFNDAAPVIADEPFRGQPPEAQAPSPRNETGQFITIGQNFTASTLFRDSGFIPPDTMGAVGNNEFVEMINGRYSAYNKSDGARIQTVETGCKSGEGSGAAI